MFWEQCWTEIKLALVEDEMTSITTMIDKLKTELRIARLEIQRLTLDVPFDVVTLRRKIAFYCHPDRGGDADVMRNVNALFDALLRARS